MLAWAVHPSVMPCLVWVPRTWQQLVAVVTSGVLRPQPGQATWVIWVEGFEGFGLVVPVGGHRGL